MSNNSAKIYLHKLSKHSYVFYNCTFTCLFGASAANGQPDCNKEIRDLTKVLLMESGHRDHPGSKEDEAPKNS